jgi:predicted transcriptional regulator
LNNWEREISTLLCITFRETGFRTSRICCTRNSCFDFIARKHEQAILVKVHSEVEHFSIKESLELDLIADRLCCAPVVVGQRTHNHMLEDDTVYTRHSVYVVNEKTLQNVLLHGTFPLVYASPGSYLVEIDGEKVRERRKELGLSTCRLAELIGASGQTLYGYEREMCRASVGNAYKLERTLGIAVAKPIDVLRRIKKHRGFLSKSYRKTLEEQRMLHRVFGSLNCCYYSSVEMAPFDFVVDLPDENLVALGVIASDDQLLNERVCEVLSVCEVSGAHPILFEEPIESSSKEILCAKA